MAFGQLFVRTGCERENSVHTQIKPTDNSFLVDCISAHKEVKLAKCKMCISFHRSCGVDVKVCECVCPSSLLQFVFSHSTLK